MDFKIRQNSHDLSQTWGFIGRYAYQFLIYILRQYNETQSGIIAWLNLTKKTVMLTQYEYNPVSGSWIAPEPKYYKAKILEYFDQNMNCMGLDIACGYIVSFNFTRASWEFVEPLM